MKTIDATQDCSNYAAQRWRFQLSYLGEAFDGAAARKPSLSQRPEARFQVVFSAAN